MKHNEQIGVVVINVGTPDAPQTTEVRRFLREFLSDPRVVDINPIGRWLLLNFAILPFRPAKSAEAYRCIWSEQGSPLLVHSLSFAKKLEQALGEKYRVRAAMRYGNPSIEAAFEEFRKDGIDHVVIFPAYPQYASSSTGTSIAAALEIASRNWNVGSTSVIPAFYNDKGFYDAFATIGRPVLDDFSPDHILFSYHGLPERQIEKSDESGKHCLQSDNCCDQIGLANRFCYRAQCMATSRSIAAQLELSDDKWTTTFQSRLGRAKWIEPYTDVVVEDLAKKGVKRLAVFCPAFVADCLETLEEISIRAQEDFVANGGEELVLIPSLNDHDAWVSAAANLVRKHSNA